MSTSTSTVWYHDGEGSTVEISLDDGQGAPTLRFIVNDNTVELELDRRTTTGRRALDAVEAFRTVLLAGQRAGDRLAWPHLAKDAS
ncbi:MAG: hypothetical protein EKK42_26555 [Pseudonocardiaceae bacterium]|nr:MAG: hypothetical protein EKK42_26555 [Pseudonocardiaceae bacterium]